jgi:hypothetical protein
VADPFSYLGLDADADERTIKRAYARLLRSARPDSDAADFQALNDAYRAALHWAQQRDARRAMPSPAWRSAASVADAEVTPAADAEPSLDTTDAKARPAADAASHIPWNTSDRDETDLEPPSHEPQIHIAWNQTPVDVAPPAPSIPNVAEPAFDFSAFFDALGELAGAGDADALRDWLQKQPILWSLSMKSDIGRATMATLYQHAAPMPAHCLDVVLAFFDLDHVLAGQDPLRLGRLRRRLHVEWLLQHDRRDLAGRMRVAQPPVTLDIGFIYALLSRPFRWLEVAWRVLPPRRPSEVANFLRHLEADKVERLPASFRREQLAFWRYAGDRSRLSWPRFAVGIARCAALALIALIADSALAYDTGDAFTPVFLLAVAAVMGLWLGYLGWTVVQAWQARPQHADPPGAAAWWRLAFIPSVCGIGLALRWLFQKETDTTIGVAAIAAAVLVAGATLLAIVRYRRRAGSAPLRWESNGLWRVVFFVPMMKALVMAGALYAYFAPAGAAVAIAVWTADAWKQRMHLRQLLRRQ